MDNQPNHNPVQPINPRPSFEQPQQPQQPPAIQSHTPKKKGRLSTVLIILLAILALAGIGYSVFAWQQNNSLSTKIDGLEAQIATMAEEAADAAEVEDTEEVVEVQANTLKIQELGVELPLSDDLTGLVYKYSQESGLPAAEVHTTSLGGECALGMISKNEGTAPADMPRTHKQFIDYYLVYVTPQQSPGCLSDVTDAQLTPLLSAMATAVESATEL